MNELQSLSQIFQNKLFRIPDYQRGYAWQDPQLRDFWEDLLNLQTDRNHYTGLLSMKAMNRDEKKKLDADDQWLLDSGFMPYQIVDGQQRLTTFVILLNEILEFARNLPENADAADENIYLGYENMKDIKAKYICRKRPPEGFVITYLFGYENDNPSAEYLKHKILGEKYGGTLRETYYTKNLKYAKEFFSKEIAAFYRKHGKDGLADLYRKLTLHFMFNIHEIEDDYDVFVAFETMNNRGKRLTNLELLKNRLIYLTTLYDRSILDEINEAALREKINKAWKEVYYQLGRNQNAPLSDDEFLRAHWIMYFAYSRKKGDDYIKFLLRKFSHKNIFLDSAEVAAPEEDDTVPVVTDDEDEVDDPSENSEPEINVNTPGFLAPREIADYVNSLNETAEYWYYSFYPDECSSISKEEQVWIGRLNRIGIGYFRPLVTVSLVPSVGATSDERIAFYKAVERFIFIDFRLAMYQSSYQSSEFYRNTRKVYRKEMKLHEVTALLNKITDGDIPGALQVFGTKMDKRFISGDGFYSWRDLKYFLYEYEYSLVSKYKIEKLQWADLTKVVRDQVSVEHILPQTPTKYYWRNQFRQFIGNDDEMKCLAASLGNLLPLSKSINSKLQNDSFEEKKERGYYNGSHSEIEVSKEADWDAQRIYKRGIKLLHFMEERWNFKFASQEQMDDLLHISFVNDGRDVPAEISEEDDTDVSDQTSDDLRLQYWTKALPVLADAFGGNSTYSNVSPATRSTIDGFVGIYGVHLYCSMRLQKQTLSANVWIDVEDKEKNKQIFDVMYRRREQVEAAIPHQIKWNRRDDTRSSTVNVELENVVFSDTSLWDEQIKFLADTCVALKNELIDPCADEIREIYGK
jgi:hypothetical protein